MRGENDGGIKSRPRKGGGGKGKGRRDTGSVKGVKDEGGRKTKEGIKTRPSEEGREGRVEGIDKGSNKRVKERPNSLETSHANYTASSGGFRSNLMQTVRL